MALLSRLARISLLWKFALVNLIPILLLGLVLQHYLHSRVSERAIDDATKQALATSRSEVERFLSEHDLKHGLTKPEVLALDETLQRPENREHVQAITVWNRSLKVVYSPRRGEINRQVPLSNDVKLALSGRVVAHRSGSNLAVYVPLWLESLRRPAGAVEISVDYSRIEAGVRDRTNNYSLLILLALAVLYGVLFRIVARASKALRHQAEVNEHQALHDSLTDLPNRTLFHDRVRHALGSARREHVPAAVMIMDLDRFKEVNDTLGHASGDELLKQVGIRLSESLRESDTVARLGGDEFGVLLPKVVDAEAAVAVARKLRTTLEEPFTIHGLALQMEASVGIALYPDHGDDVQSLLQRADVAMYVAKEHPAGCEVYTRERDDYSPDRLTLLTELRRAIDRGELAAPLPAQGRPPYRRDRRRRGARPLAAPGARDDPARRVHPAGAEDRRDRAADDVRPRRGAPPVPHVVASGTRALRRREPLHAQPARPPPPGSSRRAPGAAGRSRRGCWSSRSPRARSSPTPSARCRSSRGWTRWAFASRSTTSARATRRSRTSSGSPSTS